MKRIYLGIVHAETVLPNGTTSITTEVIHGLYTSPQEAIGAICEITTAKHPNARLRSPRAFVVPDGMVIEAAGILATHVTSGQPQPKYGIRPSANRLPKNPEIQVDSQPFGTPATRRRTHDRHHV